MSDFWNEERRRLRQMRRQVRKQTRDEIRGRMRDSFETRRTPPQSPYTGSVSMHLIVGLLVVVLGVLFLVSNLHILEMRAPMRYFWPAAFLAIGVALMIEHRSESSRQWGIGWIFVGLWSVAHTSGWIDVGVGDLFWPVILLGLGAYLIRRAIIDRSDQDSNSGSGAGTDGTPGSGLSGGGSGGGGSGGSGSARNLGSVVRGIAVLSGCEQKPTAQAMERAELFACMGGAKLDLRDATLVGDSTRINVVACMGGIEICAPSEWTVISHVVPIMGAYVDKRRPSANPPGTMPTKTLILEGFVLMGGIEIKN